LDDVDRKLISELQMDGRTTFTKLGKLVGYTSMGVKKRLKKMLGLNAIKITALMNVNQFDFSAAVMLLEMESAEAMENLLERFKNCPRVVNVFTTLGGFNLIAVIIAEDSNTLESISIEKCSLRSSKGIRRSELYPISRIKYEPFLAIREHLTHKDRVISPCGVDCRPCQQFKDNKCVGCPTAEYYRGNL